MGDAKLMQEKVLKVSCRYLLLFLSYRENPAGGGAESPPPPAGRGIMVKVFLTSPMSAKIHFYSAVQYDHRGSRAPDLQ